MATKKQKVKKRKDREKVVKVKVLSRLENLRKQRKKEKDDERREQAELEAINGKLKPYRKNIEIQPEQEATHIETVKNQLENNLKILEALEQEYEAEQAMRSDVNASLESEGHMTMRQKMDALHQKALEATGKAEELSKAQKEFDNKQL